jgi:hypothetical protein
MNGVYKLKELISPRAIAGPKINAIRHHDTPMVEINRRVSKVRAAALYFHPKWTKLICRGSPSVQREASKWPKESLEIRAILANWRRNAMGTCPEQKPPPFKCLNSKQLVKLKQRCASQIPAGPCRCLGPRLYFGELGGQCAHGPHGFEASALALSRRVRVGVRASAHPGAEKLGRAELISL